LKGIKLWLFVGFALASAAVFVRLGFWQISRLHERRAQNALIISRLDSAEVDVNDIPRDTALARFRLVRVAGIPDYDHELVFAARNYNGSPGVNFLTPVRFPGRDTAVVVDRGWVYTPDGSTIDHKPWRDRDSVFTGYVEEYPSTGGITYVGKPTIIARLSADVVRKALPYPVAPVYVVALNDSVKAMDRIVRLSVPPLDEGPHKDYAIQWFFFASVALFGAGYVIFGGR
jgi:surfeit locus 1 family protein